MFLKIFHLQPLTDRADDWKYPHNIFETLNEVTLSNNFEDNQTVKHLAIPSSH